MKSTDSVILLWVLVCGIITFTTTQDAPASLSCDWPTNPGKLKSHIASESPTTIADIGNLTTCRKKCMSQTTFICAAVNYQQSTGDCQLLTENDRLATAEAAAGWVYSVRPICAGMWLPWKFIKKGSTNDGEGEYVKTNNTESLQTCMVNCLRDESGGKECRSITTSTDGKTCKLSSARLREEDKGRLRISDEWQYLSRPSWYLESSNSSSGSDVGDHGKLGTFLQIFLENKVPVNGYVVAWQYYLYYANPSSSKKKMCTNYAGIWRPLGKNRYKLVSRTLLSPEDETNGGVRFQFVQNQMARVEKGDLLSVISEAKDNYCSSRVSAGVGNIETISVPIYGSVPGNIIRYRRKHRIRHFTTSLKVYLSELLYLKSAPQPYHNETLEHGQVWLRLPPPLTTEDSVVVAGYRVMCATNGIFVPTIPCHEDLIPVGTQITLLNLPDVTKPYYAAVQIVRNFNGEELPEKIYSPSTAPFCAGRFKEGQVKPPEAVDGEDMFEVNIKIKSDFCTEKVKLNYSGYDSDYRAIEDGDHPTFLIKLDKDTTYSLNAYVKTPSGDELLLWRYVHTTATTHTTASTNVSTAASTTHSSASSEHITAITAHTTARTTASTDDRTQHACSTVKSTKKPLHHDGHTLGSSPIVIASVVIAFVTAVIVVVIVWAIVKRRRRVSGPEDIIVYSNMD